MPDLHDNLFQNIQGLLLAIDNSTNVLAEGDPTRGALKTLLQRSDQVMAESREQVLELRAQSLDRESIGQALSKVGHELTKVSTAIFRVVELGASERLHPLVFQEVFAICREALSNAFRHSGAKHIEAEVLFTRDTFSVRIRDDGRGIDAQVIGDGKPGHFGLKGMTERAKKLGGKIVIRSSQQAGTEVEFSIPRAIASGLRRDAFLWPWVRRSKDL